MTKEMHDFIIIGGGAAGYAAGVYAARFGMKTAIITKEKGGLLTTTHIVENWPGIISDSGTGVMEKLEAHVKSYKVPIVVDTVTSVTKDGDTFVVETAEGTKYTTWTVLFATGTKHRKLNAPGEDQYANKGVSYCATCDGPLFSGEVLGVVGGSDSAAKESLLLAEYGTKVYIIYRGDQIHPEPINMERVQALVKQGKIEIINNTNITSIEGNGSMLTHVMLDKPHNGSNKLEIGGLFIEIGHLPQSELAGKLGVALNKKGEIIIDRLSRTNVDGVYGAGDVGDLEFKQAITGAGEGVTAAYSAYEYISGKKIVPT